MMKRSLGYVLTLGLIAAGLVACSTQKLNYRNPSAQPGHTHTVKRNFWLWGYLAAEKVDLQRICPAGVAGISSQNSFLDRVVTGLTVGLYQPVSIKVQCQTGLAYQIRKQDDAVAVTAINAP